MAAPKKWRKAPAAAAGVGSLASQEMGVYKAMVEAYKAKANAASRTRANADGQATGTDSGKVVVDSTAAGACTPDQAVCSPPQDPHTGGQVPRAESGEAVGPNRAPADLARAQAAEDDERRQRAHRARLRFLELEQEQECANAIKTNRAPSCGPSTDARAPSVFAPPSSPQLMASTPSADSTGSICAEHAVAYHSRPEPESDVQVDVSCSKVRE